MSAFDELVKKLEAQGKSTSEAKAIAAAVGRKKYGAKAFAAKAAAGRKAAK